MDSLYLRYMHTTHLLTSISPFKTPTLSLSRANTLPSFPDSPPPMIYSAMCVKVPLTSKNYFSVTYVTPIGIWTAFSLTRHM